MRTKQSRSRAYQPGVGFIRSMVMLCAAVSLLVLSTTALNAQQTGARSGDSDQLPEGPGRDLVFKNCNLCHTLDRVVSVKRTKADWQRLVQQMWQRRAPFSEDDIPTIVDYLSANFGRPDIPPRPMRVSGSLPAGYAGYDFSKPGARGTLTGMVTADVGAVHAFTVTAHNLLYRVQYTVLTKDGRYTVPQALPGPYEIFGETYGYSSPTQKGELKPSGSATVDLAFTKDPPPEGVTYVDMDTVYPPGPGRDLYMKNCAGCHATGPHWKMQLTPYGYRMGVEYMRWGRAIPDGNGASPVGRTQLSLADMDAIGHYLGSVLDPNLKRVARRPDYPTDESVVSKAVFVQYDMPEDFVKAHGGRAGSHDAFMAMDGKGWFGSGGSMVSLDPKEQDPVKRLRIYNPAPGQTFGINGIAEDRVRHHIYFADTEHGELGEVNPDTGQITLHMIPLRGFLHSLYGDSKGNIWYANIYGSSVGKYDPATGHVSSYPSITEDIGPYGVTEDHQGNIWIAGVSKGLIARFDPETLTMTEFKTPTPGSGPKRIRADSKDIMWFSEAANQTIGRLDPKTGVITEFKLPVPNISPYSIWVDRKDENIIWGSDLLNDHGFAPFSFNTKTKKMYYYPSPEGTQAPETFTEPNNTEWMVHTNAAGIHFYPDGYTSDAPPEP